MTGCGFEWDRVVGAELASRLAEAGARFRRILLPTDRDADWTEQVRTRPSPDTWSPIEYACHVRDVLLVQRDRAYRALVEDAPEFSPMGREERVTLAGVRRRGAERGRRPDRDGGEPRGAVVRRALEHPAPTDVRLPVPGTCRADAHLVGCPDHPRGRTPLARHRRRPRPARTRRRPRPTVAARRRAGRDDREPSGGRRPRGARGRRARPGLRARRGFVGPSARADARRTARPIPRPRSP